MGERTICVTCRDCGRTFMHQTKSNRPKLLCEPCRLDAIRVNSHNGYLKRLAENPPTKMVRTCLDCPADLTGSPGRTLRCGRCRKELARQVQRDLRAARPKAVREFFCIRCETKIERSGNSGKPLYCPAHAADALRESQLRTEAKRTAKRAAPRITHCHYCGVKFDRPRFRAKTPNRCEECKKDRHRTYIRAYYAKRPRGFDHVRRARKMGVGYERFTVMEIFERDRWKCGICCKRISRRLRYTNPLSASLDHKVPLAKGGTHSRSNVQASHLRCNLRKRTAAAPMGEQIPLPL